jgi:Flp pilus assembly protein TadD
MRVNRDRSTAGVLRRAAELTARGKATRAVGLLRPVVIAEPDNGAAWCTLASAELAAGRTREALDALDNVVRDPSAAARAERVRALVLLRLGDPEGAVSAAEDAVSTDPDDWRAHSVLARVHAEVGDPERARAADAWARRLIGAPADAVAFADTRPKRSRSGSLPSDEPALPGSGESLLRKPLRRLAVIGTLGALFLLMAGMPAPAGVLAWLGAAFLIVLGVVAARTVPRSGLGAQPVSLRVAVVTFGLTVTALLGWTVMLAWGAHSLWLLGFAFGSGAVSVASTHLEALPALLKRFR